ncbi:MAG: glycosyltransferase [Proteobacteria bacterium]|jgi:GT2 family glycosyltransferase|nr:glycosyltransferase [Pseudomonadota bacterium]
MQSGVVLSIVVPCLNHIEITKGFLSSIFLNTENNFEVIVIDDGSDDETQNIEFMFPEIDLVIRNRENKGFAYAVNQGIKMSRGGFIAIFNNDMIVKEGWDVKLINAIGDYGMISGTLKEPPISVEEFEKMEEPERDEICDWEKGMPWVFKKEVFEKIGIFDERFEICQYEDIDLLVRMAIGGYKFASLRNCFIYHYSSLTQKTDLKERIPFDYARRNAERFVEKWGVSYPDGVNYPLFYERGRI